MCFEGTKSLNLVNSGGRKSTLVFCPGMPKETLVL